MSASERFTVRLTPDEADVLRRLAVVRKLTPSTLAHQLLVGAMLDTRVGGPGSMRGDGDKKSLVKIGQVASGDTTVEVRVFVGDDQVELDHAREVAITTYRAAREEVHGGKP